ncbi:helix-turn-helix domain-containing protein [Nocardia salmonicida]|uniref:helix-turn-helix domain-containing protein n=1 Tax=Nocardia salmonicida TaxID=53431 RepID=UPI000B32D96C
MRQAVADSGLTSAEFAVAIGTSGSRLSTYMTGKVVPSSTLMVRIRRVADRYRSVA